MAFAYRWYWCFVHGFLLRQSCQQGPPQSLNHRSESLLEESKKPLHKGHSLSKCSCSISWSATGFWGSKLPATPYRGSPGWSPELVLEPPFACKCFTEPLKKGSWNIFWTPSRKIREPQFLRFGLLELLLNNWVFVNAWEWVQKCVESGFLGAHLHTARQTLPRDSSCSSTAARFLSPQGLFEREKKPSLAVQRQFRSHFKRRFGWGHLRVKNCPETVGSQFFAVRHVGVLQGPLGTYPEALRDILMSRGTDCLLTASR